MRKSLVGIAFLLCSGSMLCAQNLDAIQARQTIYKSFIKATKPVGAMLAGKADFDLDTVKAALTTYAAGAKKLPGLFPDDSKTGGDTAALPEIWTNKSDFEARLNKFSADSEAALAGITDKASFMATFPKIVGQCGDCHKTYRAKT